MENVVFSDESQGFRLSLLCLRSINSNDNERDLRCSACAGGILQV